MLLYFQKRSVDCPENIEHLFTLKRENKMQPFIFLIAFLTLLISTPVSALTGRVVNQTLNRVEPDIEVSYILHETGDVTVVRDTTDSKGQFTLDVPSDPGAEPPPMLFARYNGIDYPGNPAPAGDTVDIPVFETTESDTAISLSSHHILLDAQAGTATYIIIVHNRGDRTYLTGGDHGHGLEIPLPDGVTDILSRTARRTPTRPIAR